MNDATGGSSPTQTQRDQVVYGHIWTTEAPRPPSSSFGRLTDLLRAECPEPPYVADIGCGPGRHALYAASLGFRVVAVDHSAEAIARVRADPRSASCEVRHGDAFEWLREQPDSTLDGLVCFDVIHHAGATMPEVAQLLALLRSKVRIGGIVLVTLLCDISYSSGEDPPHRLRVTVEDGDRLLVTAFVGDEVLKARHKPVDLPDAVSWDGTQLIASRYRATRVLTMVRRLH